MQLVDTRIHRATGHTGGWGYPEIGVVICDTPSGGMTR